MAFFIGRDREARRAYGFDEVALVPGHRNGESRGHGRVHTDRIG
jgi:IMP dehydrogenase/GMP reductase